MVARYRPNVDYTSATAGTDDGHVVFTPNVAVSSITGTSNVAITSPLGTNTIAASVAVTPATSSSWATTAAQLPATLGPKSAATSLSTTPAGLLYETVAASQTAQVLGGSGATGDYLSHVNVQPTSTSPGVITVLDNAIEVAAWPGGTVGADLTPFTIPVNAYSVSGAWKITSGANVKCTAFGVFT